jgi:putative nucleotidyltransferase with HDIG domain
MSSRVATLAHAIATALGLDPDARERIALAARIHDVGRFAVREVIFAKPGPLTPAEFDHVKEHVRRGLEILAPFAALPEVVEAVADHHEHWDGSGYPRGIAGSRISIGGRILCAADAFVALTSRRSYRPAMSADDTLSYLAVREHSLLDPAVSEALRSVVTERRVLGLTVS